MIPFIAPLLVSGIIIFALLVYGWYQRKVRIGLLFFLTISCLFIWVATTFLEFISPSLATKLFWANIAFIGIAYLPVFWLLVVIDYTGQWQRWQRYLPWLFVIPTITNLLVWTNSWHHWWRGVSSLKDNIGPISLVAYDYQFWFYVHAAYGYVLFLVSLIMLIQKLRVTQGIYRRQIVLLLASTLLPVISDTLYVLGISPIPDVNPTPLVFAFSGILLTVALFRHRFLDLMPVARNKLIENMSDAMLVLDNQNRIVDLNPSMQRVLKVQEEQVIGTTVNKYLSEWGIDLNEIRKAIGTYQEINLEQDDITITYDLHVSPLDEPGKPVTGYLIVLRDITHRVQLENELRLKNEDLETFAHMVAHDLKSPLGVIMGFSEILPTLLPTNEYTQAIKYLQIINKTTQKMDSIIYSLLLLATVREQDVVVQTINMADIVDEAIERLRFDIEASGAVIVKPTDWPAVVGYETWIEEVWVNYISNGLKYGGQPPHITLAFAEQQNNMVRFEVQDNGPGIKPEDIARLFSSFTRLDAEKAEGHGLGLSIVQRIVTRLGGKVGVASTLGAGSTFYFTLPTTAVSRPLLTKNSPFSV
jgi:PAS domain S-box-containing protein